MRRILVTGDREWTDRATIRLVLTPLYHADPATFVLISGAARGADTIAYQVAKRLGLPSERNLRFPADWRKFGSGAGPIRNRQMLAEGQPEQVLAFHADLAHSHGTRDMVLVALAAGLPVSLYRGRRADGSLVPPFELRAGDPAAIRLAALAKADQRAQAAARKAAAVASTPNALTVVAEIERT
jgi:hypothetical protein